MTRLLEFCARAAVALIVVLVSTSRGQTPPPDFEITPEERAAVIQGTIQQLNAFYVFPDVAKKIEETLRQRETSGEYASLKMAREFAQRLKTDLRNVSNDRHLGVMFFKDGAPTPPAATPTPAQIAAQRPFMAKLNFGFEKAERMQGNIGYLEIRGFVPAELGGETAAAAMTFLAHTDALIIDLRKNSGGEPSMIAYLLTYLFDAPTHLNDIVERDGTQNHRQQWWTLPYVPGAKFGQSKPVFILTSRQTFSGGEEFAYDLKSLRRGTLIGEKTGGGAHPSRPVKVAERFMIELPYARAVNPVTGTNWERTGVTPDIEVSAEEALETAYTMAAEKVIESTDNTRQKEQLQRLLEERKKTVPKKEP